MSCSAARSRPTARRRADSEGRSAAPQREPAGPLVALAPYHESGYCLLMRGLAAEGNAAEGLLVYEQLRRLLNAELGAAPSAATQALHRSLLGA